MYCFPQTLSSCPDIATLLAWTHGGRTQYTVHTTGSFICLRSSPNVVSVCDNVESNDDPDDPNVPKDPNDLNDLNDPIDPIDMMTGSFADD